MSDSEPQSTLGAALAAIQASVSTETTDADATALATADSAAHGASVKVVAATPANSRRRNSSTSAKGEEVKPASAKKKGHPAVGSEVESETAEAVEDSSASGSGEEAPQKEGPANPKKVQGKDVETSALPVPMIDNGDFVETRPRKSLRVSNRESTQPPKAEKKESFPQQIHRFVTDMMTTNPAMITFTDDGEKIQVREDHPDIGEFMEESVGNAHLGFFSQKLLSYGWSRDSDPKSHMLYFSHPYFHRDQSKCEFSKIVPRKRPPLPPLPPSTSGSPPPPSVDEEWDKSAPVAAEASSDDGNRVEAKFRVFQTVYARDTDGVMYEAVIRRRLYGQSQHKQVQLGLVASEHEAEELLSREEEPTWHYYVHYNKWNVNWDRWVPEANVYEATDRIKAYAERLLGAHRSLRADLTKKVKGKKGFQTVEGSEFLQRWRIVRAKVDEEMRPDGDPPLHENTTAAPTETNDESHGPSSANGGTSKSSTKKAESSPWSSNAEILNETKLRERRLTSVGCGGRGRQVQHQLILPFALKKCLVESWEVITQCGMVLELPAPVTVRHALDMYLQSKGITSDPTVGDAAVGGDAANEETSVPTPPTPPEADPSPADEDSDAKHRQLDQQQREWRDMADGIALMFDEALPDRLLYREEWPQFHVLCDHPEYAMRRLSDLYGCEHLLRLFVRLPGILADELSESDARPVLAKVNDLVRFLHKNQGAVLAQPYRKLTDLEEKERAKLTKKEEARRKRRSEAAAVPGEGGAPTSKKQKADTLVESVEVVMH